MTFRKCPNCKKTWDSLDSFIADPDIRYIGYQAAFTAPQLGRFLFTHHVAGCGTTLTLIADKLIALLPDQTAGTRDPVPMATHVNCLGFCKDEKSIENCPVDTCAGASIRKIMRTLRTKR